MEPRDQSTDSIPQPSAPAPASPHSDSTPRPQRSASPKETPASEDGEIANADPPLPDEEAPPLPDEAPPQDDGWEPLWDQNAGAYYFYNHLTGVSQWENPRVPDATAAVQASYDRFALNLEPFRAFPA
ncbi:hypothetical protein M011DRAFT_472415 [Sporormia fimetaria CBS 119925]|uniref:WW domain-containing protein n=1 Tax=Sporormia fimetaria CBS 119925 TaxID=1340428 RepID=A0A6A6UV94_9PLEO|nr:hypothetical protein M011DRAFT_472415 [Sporormia fimetaria CBS 119925]